MKLLIRRILWFPLAVLWLPVTLPLAVVLLLGLSAQWVVTGECDRFYDELDPPWMRWPK